MDVIQAYHASGVTDDNPVHLIVLLHEQLLRDFRRALDAFEKQEIERRADELDHALVVIGQLQGTLNLESGGEVAHNLDQFYTLLRGNLLRAVLEGSAALLQKQLQHVSGLRDAWLEVERQMDTSASPGAPRQAEPGNAERASQGSLQWKV